MACLQWRWSLSSKKPKTYSRIYELIYFHTITKVDSRSKNCMPHLNQISPRSTRPPCSERHSLVTTEMVPVTMKRLQTHPPCYSSFDNIMLLQFLITWSGQYAGGKKLSSALEDCFYFNWVLLVCHDSENTSVCSVLLWMVMRLM